MNGRGGRPGVVRAQGERVALIGLMAEDRILTIAAEQLFSTEREPLASPVKLDNGPGPVELPTSCAECMPRIDSPVSLFCTLAGEGPSARALLAFSPEGGPVAEVGVGDWSETFVRDEASALPAA